MSHHERFDELKAIIASLYYLESEAKRSGLAEISHIFRKAIADVESFLKGESLDKRFYKEKIIDSDLYRILKLLDEFSKENKFDLRAIVRTIEMYEEMTSPTDSTKLAA